MNSGRSRSNKEQAWFVVTGVGDVFFCSFTVPIAGRTGFILKNYTGAQEKTLPMQAKMKLIKIWQKGWQKIQRLTAAERMII